MIRINIEFKINIYRDSGKQVNKSASRKDATNRESFLDFARNEIEKSAKNKSFSTVKNYQTAIRSLKEYARDKDITFGQIDENFMFGYQKWLQQKGVCLNTISCYIRSLRSIYNVASEQGKTVHQNPFKKVYTGNAKTDKRSMEPEEIKRLQEVSVRSGSFQEMARDIFLFCFYALGMPFVDFAFLRKSQIHDDVLTYDRRKTGQRINVKIEPCMQQIIKRYWNPESEYVFPIITTTDRYIAYKQYQDALSRYNRTLKSLAKRAHISKRLTSYCARHTWASVAFQQNVDLSVISKALGHTDNKLLYNWIVPEFSCTVKI